MRNIFRPLFRKLAYRVELISLLIVILAVGITYGIIEAKWIPTDEMSLPLLGRFSYYHVWLLILMAVVSFSSAISRIHLLIANKKRYILFMCLASLPLALMIEDATWFFVRWTPIEYDEWTMISPGLGINLGFSWIPLWYIISMAFSSTMLYLSSRYVDKSRRKEYLIDHK